MIRAKVLTMVAIVALIVGAASPAGAGGPYGLDATSGIMDTLLSGFFFDLDFDPSASAGSPCSLAPDALVLSIDDDGPGTWAIEGGFERHFQWNYSTSPWFQADYTVLTLDGTYAANPTPQPDAYLDGAIYVLLEISELDPWTCDKAGLECTVAGLYAITSGEFEGSLPNPVVGDQAVIDADTTSSGFPLAVSNCAAPLVALAGTDASLGAFTVEYV